MKALSELFASNRAWAERMRREDPDFFARLARQQMPEYLWIGCADSRVPANEIVGLRPGELFVHRNVANLVVQTDLNCLTVLQFAVDLLGVKHIIVCGHYGCSGVRAALARSRIGLSDNWLRQVDAVRARHDALLSGLADETQRLDRLCELNVLEQVVNVARTTVLQDAWARGQEVTLHGWIYGISDGLLRDLNLLVSGPEMVQPRYQEALAEMEKGRRAA
ncbi:MAG: carbonate dehydratase [Betaproteobacteria bacterium]|nr:carbonate dehydratase [Betaproteobacteria bacterium]